YTIVPLTGLQRNGAIFEATPGGTFAGQVYRAGTAGIWLDADAGGGFDDHLWWPLTVIEDSSTLHVGAWLNDYLSGTAHGTNVDSHIVTLNFFGGYGSTTPLNLGDNAPLFN